MRGDTQDVQASYQSLFDQCETSGRQLLHMARNALLTQYERPSIDQILHMAEIMQRDFATGCTGIHSQNIRTGLIHVSDAIDKVADELADLQVFVTNSQYQSR